MSRDILAAVRVLADCYERLELDHALTRANRLQGQFILFHAIRHISQPERTIYPKVRGASKGNPVTNKTA